MFGVLGGAFFIVAVGLYENTAILVSACNLPLFHWIISFRFSFFWSHLFLHTWGWFVFSRLFFHCHFSQTQIIHLFVKCEIDANAETKEFRIFKGTSLPKAIQRIGCQSNYLFTPELSEICYADVFTHTVTVYSGLWSTTTNNYYVRVYL